MLVDYMRLYHLLNQSSGWSDLELDYGQPGFLGISKLGECQPRLVVWVARSLQRACFVFLALFHTAILTKVLATICYGSC